MIARPTDALLITRQLREEIINDCDRPDVFRAILDRARDIVFGRSTVEEFDAFCAAQGCVCWMPEDTSKRHVNVRCRREPDTVVISIARVAWAMTHVCLAQGPGLKGSEELQHICGHNGAAHTGQGACLNPIHLWRGDHHQRITLKMTRQMMKSIGLKHVEALAQ